MQPDQNIIYLNPRDLKPSRQNVRSDAGDLAGLAETIREHGILQPLGIRAEEGEYQVVYGNRRREAAIVVGLDRVPCVMVAAQNPQEVMVQQILENLQRLDLNDMDKAQAFAAMLAHLTEGGMAQGTALDHMARTLGLSSRQIQRYLRLLQLPPTVRAWVARGDIGVTQAQHLVELYPEERQETVAQLAIDESISAAELARLVNALQRNPNIAPQQALDVLRQGGSVPRLESRPDDPRAGLRGGMGPEPGRSNADEDDEEPDSEQESEQGSSAARRERDDYAFLEPATHDGNRVFKIHSLDAFMDLVQRLTECAHSGDLQRLMEEDEGSKVKIGLAARQLLFLTDAVHALAKTEA
ncbi:MAG: ParB/RepB/Spo0J family partition protein [Anaerolineae bacterium]|jgi:ParB family chromosome partitioning protein|nr:ParB/RepB/Spo0J family partition protein [Chloroflexota bacterium]